MIESFRERSRIREAPFRAIGERPSSVAPADRNDTGLLVTLLTLRPIYVNAAAVRILQYPDVWSGSNGAAVQDRVRSMLHTDRFVPGASDVDFLSGRRQYVCRSYLLTSYAAARRRPLVTIVLERRTFEPLTLPELSRRFRLSPREAQTAHHLIEGLTTKEIAGRMGVSPNTVKQFVRLTMSKMRVTTRSGIVGKFFS